MQQQTLLTFYTEKIKAQLQNNCYRIDLNPPPPLSKQLQDLIQRVHELDEHYKKTKIKAKQGKMAVIVNNICSGGSSFTDGLDQLKNLTDDNDKQVGYQIFRIVQNQIRYITWYSLIFNQLQAKPDETYKLPLFRNGITSIKQLVEGKQIDGIEGQFYEDEYINTIISKIKSLKNLLKPQSPTQPQPQQPKTQTPQPKNILQLQAKLTNLTQQIQTLTTTNTTLTNDIRQKQFKIRELENRKLVLEREKEDYERVVGGLRGYVKELEKCVESMRVVEEQNKGEISRIKSQKENLQFKVQMLNKDKQQLVAQQITHSQQYSKLQIENEQLKKATSNKDMIIQLSALKQQNSQLKNIKAILKSQYDNLININTTLKSQNENLNQRNTSLNFQKDNLSNTNRNIQQVLQQKQSQLKSQLSEITNLQNQLNQLKQHQNTQPNPIPTTTSTPSFLNPNLNLNHFPNSNPSPKKQSQAQTQTQPQTQPKPKPKQKSQKQNEPQTETQSTAIRQIVNSKDLLFLYDLILGYQHNSFVKPKQSYLEERDYLVRLLENYCKRKISRTKLIFQHDKHNQTNFHQYIDNIPNYILLVKLQNNNIIAAYSQTKLDKTTSNNDPSFISSLTLNKTVFIEPSLRSSRATTYNEYYIIFGNDQFRLHPAKKRGVSCLGYQYSYFRPKVDPVDLLGLDGEDFGYLELEVWKVFFQNQEGE